MHLHDGLQTGGEMRMNLLQMHPTHVRHPFASQSPRARRQHQCKRTKAQPGSAPEAHMQRPSAHQHSGHGHSGPADSGAAAPSRRTSLLSLAAAAVPLQTAVGAAAATDSPAVLEAEAREAERQEEVDTTITDRVYFDIGLCPEMLNRARTVGDKSALCSDPAAVGRIVIGLYGKHLPITTANFKRAVEQGLYTGTTFHKIFPGTYIQGGKQGSRRMGEVFVPKDAQDTNPELLKGASYRLPHLRPGTVSLMLSSNDDYPDIKQAREYRNMQFLITTGPGPVPSLDGENVVFGKVLEGLDVVASIKQVPTFMPNESAKQMNAVANFFGDDRASKAKAKWGKPLKAVQLTQAGVLPP